MFFRNLQLYRLAAGYALTAEALATMLAPVAFVPATSAEMLRIGFAPVREGQGLVHACGGQLLLRLVTEKKLLPASVIKQVAHAKALEMEEAQGFAVGRKALKELRERVADELLPRAFPIRSDTMVWIDPIHGWLAIDASSASKADDVVKLLLKVVDRMPLESLRVERSPTAVMTAWLDTDEAPAGFTVDQDAKLQSTGESRASVRYAKHTLDAADMKRHIATGKQCTSLALTWNDKISFVLDESLSIKSIKPLDVLREGTTSTRDDQERFDSDFTLMAGELNQLLVDLMAALGGEAADLVSPARTAAKVTVEKMVKMADKMYDARDTLRKALGDKYPPLMREYAVTIRAVMALTGHNEIMAAAHLCKTELDPRAKMHLVAAAVEMVEPSDPAQISVKVLETPAPHAAGDGPDPLYEKAVIVVMESRRASISLVQRHLAIGYNRAARLLEALEKNGVVSPMASNGARDILQQVSNG